MGEERGALQGGVVVGRIVRRGGEGCIARWGRIEAHCKVGEEKGALQGGGGEGRIARWGRREVHCKVGSSGAHRNVMEERSSLQGGEEYAALQGGGGVGCIARYGRSVAMHPRGAQKDGGGVVRIARWGRRGAYWEVGRRGCALQGEEAQGRITRWGRRGAHSKVVEGRAHCEVELKAGKVQVEQDQVSHIVQHCSCFGYNIQ